MKQQIKKGCEALCALSGGLFFGGMICRLFLTPGDTYEPVLPAARAGFIVCLFLLLGFAFFRILRKAAPAALAVLIPLLWIVPLFRPCPIPEMLTGFFLGGVLAVLGQRQETILIRLLSVGFAVAFCAGGCLPCLCDRIALLGIVAAALAGSFRILMQTAFTRWRYPLILLVLVSAFLANRRGLEPFSYSILPPPPVFPASLMTETEDKVNILLVTDRLEKGEKPLAALPYVNGCTVLSWRDFSTLCSTKESTEYDLVALDTMPGRSGAFKCEALRQGLRRTRKGGVLVYPGFAEATPVPAGALSAVSLPWDENRYFAAAVRPKITTDQEKLDDRLQQYQNAFDFEIFPSGVFTAIYHGVLPQITLHPLPPEQYELRPLPGNWWHYAAGAALFYYLLRLLLCRKERFGAVFAAQENAISFGLMIFAAVQQANQDFLAPLPAFLFFGLLLLPLLAFRSPPGKGLLLLGAGWLLPLCWLAPPVAGNWYLSAAIAVAGVLSAGYSCFRQNRSGWVPAGSVTGNFLGGLLAAALIVLVLQSFQVPLLPLAAAGCFILRTGVTLRS